MELRIQKQYSIQEYLDMEAKSDAKHEYHDGWIVAMAGGVPEHDQIATNTSTALNIILRDKDCIVYGSNLKVAIDAKNKMVYPDGMVICGEAEMYKNQKDAIINPMLVIEVLSPSTERYDRSGKFRLYKSLPSFKEYMLIAVDTPLVETFYREEENYWHIASAVGLDKSIYLKSIDFNIQLADIYLKVKGLQNPQSRFDL